MRKRLSELDGQAFDIVIVGAGVNGGSAAQHAAAAGYSVLLIDKGDFGSGSSGRSSRLLHCGLRYLAPGASMWDFARHPGRLRYALAMAKKAMECREEFVRQTPERAREMTFCFPFYKDGPYAAWQIDLGFSVLRWLGPRALPLDYRRISLAEGRNTPIVQGLRDYDQLQGIAAFREYRFDWPERLCVDMALDAERMGAVARNYTAAAGQTRNTDGSWSLSLRDERSPAQNALVTAKVILNTAGIWIDRVNRSSNRTAKRRITGTKGVHLMVQLPPECADFGIATLHRENEPFYCVPWRGMHYFGPTETLYEGDIDAVAPGEDDIEWIIAEANFLLPALNLERSDVLFAWAGVRPLTYDPEQPRGARARMVHDLSEDGMPNVFAMTAGPIMTHRSAGPELLKAVGARIAPSGAPQDLSHAARMFPEMQNAPPLDTGDPAVKLSDLVHAAEREHATDLIDLLFRRTGTGWNRGMGAAVARKAAEAVAGVLGWDAARIDAEVARYHAYLAEQHRTGPEA
jgi:glycerol-3-phosphate dehydrogenase